MRPVPSEFLPRFHVLTVEQIKYVWGGRRSWSEFISPHTVKYLTWLPEVFALFLAVRHLGTFRVVTGLTVP